MAISITRSKAAKESSAIEKAKGGPPPNSDTTPRSTRETSKAKTSEGQIPSYYKAKTSGRQIPSHARSRTSSRFESQSLKQLKSDASNQKPSVINRRPSVEKPASNSKPKAKELSSSRPHKALVSHGPPHKTPSLLRTSSTPTAPSPIKTTISSKPISKTPPKTAMAAKPNLTWSRKATNLKKTAPATKKVADDPVNSENPPESSDATEETSRLETLPPVTEQEVEKVPEIPPHVDSTEQNEQQRKVEPDQPQIQADDKRAIPSALEGEPVSVTQVEEAKGEPKEEKSKGEHGEEENTSQGESNDWRHPEKQPATDGDVEVKEKEKEDGGVIGDEESEYNNEGKTLKEKKGEDTGTSEDKTDRDELVPKSGVEEVKTESTPPKEEAGKESEARVNVVEETASNLLETRKNKVLALAGAFQSIIDHQTSSQ